MVNVVVNTSVPWILWEWTCELEKQRENEGANLRNNNYLLGFKATKVNLLQYHYRGLYVHTTRNKHLADYAVEVEFFTSLTTKTNNNSPLPTSPKLPSAWGFTHLFSSSAIRLLFSKSYPWDFFPMPPLALGRTTATATWVAQTVRSVFQHSSSTCGTGNHGWG